MSLYEPKQLADSMRVIRKNTIQTPEDIPEAQYGRKAHIFTYTRAEMGGPI